MIRNLTASALVLAALSGAAFASGPQGAINPGDVQLARSAGVEPGQFTRAELIQIIEARRANDPERLNFYLSGSNRGSADITSSPGLDQLARIAGVEPGRFTAAELQQLINARADGDTEVVRFILSGENRKAANPANVVTPGQAQLAASLGVDPSAYTLAELVAMIPQNDD